MTKPVRPKVFHLPGIRLGKNAAVARMSQVTVQAEDSEKRVLAATPKLQKLKELMARPMP